MNRRGVTTRREQTILVSVHRNNVWAAERSIHTTTHRCHTCQAVGTACTTACRSLANLFHLYVSCRQIKMSVDAKFRSVMGRRTAAGRTVYLPTSCLQRPTLWARPQHEKILLIIYGHVGTSAVIPQDLWASHNIQSFANIIPDIELNPPVKLLKDYTRRRGVILWSVFIWATRGNEPNDNDIMCPCKPKLRFHTLNRWHRSYLMLIPVSGVTSAWDVN